MITILDGTDVALRILRSRADEYIMQADDGRQVEMYVHAGRRDTKRLGPQYLPIDAVDKYGSRPPILVLTGVVLHAGE